MKVRVEIGLAIGALLCVQVLTSFGAIALLSRMSPAIEQILEENTFSIEAAEDMLASLASADGADTGAAERKFAAALERARSNVTEPEEPAVIDRIEAVFRDALRGDLRARRELVAAVAELTQINHTSTRRADDEAQRLGRAGAWAAAFLGVLGFVLSLLAVGRLTRQILRPVATLQQTVEAFHAGDLHRRSRHGGMPAELREVAEALDELLDLHQAKVLERASATQDASETLERRALVALLARQPHPSLLVDDAGRVRAVGRADLALLDGSPEGEALRARIAQGPDAEGTGLEWERLSGGALVSVPPEAPAD